MPYRSAEFHCFSLNILKPNMRDTKGNLYLKQHGAGSFGFVRMAEGQDGPFYAIKIQNMANIPILPRLMSSAVQDTIWNEDTDINSSIHPPRMDLHGTVFQHRRSTTDSELERKLSSSAKTLGIPVAG